MVDTPVGFSLVDHLGMGFPVFWRNLLSGFIPLLALTVSSRLLVLGNLVSGLLIRFERDLGFALGILVGGALGRRFHLELTA